MHPTSRQTVDEQKNPANQKERATTNHEHAKDAKREEEHAERVRSFAARRVGPVDDQRAEPGGGEQRQQEDKDDTQSDLLGENHIEIKDDCQRAKGTEHTHKTRLVSTRLAKTRVVLVSAWRLRTQERTIAVRAKSPFSLHFFAAGGAQRQGTRRAHDNLRAARRGRERGWPRPVGQDWPRSPGSVDRCIRCPPRRWEHAGLPDIRDT